MVTPFCNGQRLIECLEVQLGRAEKLLAGLGNEHLGCQSLLKMAR